MPPDAPADLTAVVDEANASIRLEWQAAVTGFPAASFNVYRGPSSDPGSMSVLASGVMTAFYIDATPSQGTQYYQVSGVSVGGIEGPRSNAASGTIATWKGLAVAADEAGSLWEVVLGSSAIRLHKFDSGGAPLSSVPLPDAAEDGRWSIQFDGSGNAYAVGTASGPGTVGLDLAVYKVSTAADQLLGFTIFNSTGDVNDYAVDSAGDIWIAGAVESGATGQMDLALWRYVLSDGSMSLVTTYSRGGGMDLGMGIAARNDDLWVSGYSRDPSTGKLDLALWRFNGIGALVSGPHLRAGYLNDFVDGINASLAVSGDSLFVAATRHNSQGNVDLAVLKFDGQGTLLGERIWAGAAGGDDWPSGLEASADGLVAAGGSVSGQDKRLAVWRIDSQGRIVSAQTLPGQGPANGLTLAGADVWLALGSSVPYRFTGGQALPALADDSQGWGMAVAVDSSSNVWEVVGRQTGISLAKHDSQGGFDYSVSLPEASENGKWSIQFDMQGNAYAVGIASGPSTRGQDLAVYKVAAAGSPVLNSTFFNSEGDVNEYAVDSAGDIWITGAIGDAGQGQLQMALWRYAVAENGLMSLATTYSRGGGMDVGFGIAATDGHLWVSGFSRDPASGKLDLALWKFDSQGNSEGPPLLRPGYLNDFVDMTYASVARFDGSIFVAATRHNAQGDTDLAVLKFNDLGRLQSERVWQGAANGDDWAAKLKASSDGLVAAGGSMNGAENRLAVWRLDNQGHVISAQTMPAVGDSEDLAVSGADLWLAVGSSAPYKFTSGQALSGQETVLWTAAQVAMTPTVGPIGIPFTIAGAGFGAYNGANTRVKFGAAAASLSLWNDTTISGTAPGLSTGAYAVAVERQHPSSTTVWDAGTFNVTALQAVSLTPSSGPIGVPFTISGESFGPYNGANTRVMVNGAVAPLSLWNNSTISGTIPGSLGSGTHAVRIERQVGSTVSASNLMEFLVTVPQIVSLTPSSGPIGVPFTIAGTSFGPYNGANTRVLIGGATAPLSIWNDSTISGTIPGISTGIATVRVERAASGGLVAADTWYFEVTMPVVASISPSSGPIGVAFTLTGSSFGPYNGANTQVFVGTSTAALSLWNDTTIKGTVPGTLGPGPYPVKVVRKTSDGGLVESSPVSFQVAGLYLAGISPSSGPIGSPFTITGTDFDSYGGANTRVLFGGATAALSLWNDTTINGPVPPLAPGTYEVLVERQSGEGVSRSNTAVFTVNGVLAQGMTPSSGPIGVAFTISGLGFGPYNGANTRVLIGGTTAPLSLWTDTVISGTIPGVSSGTKEVFVERASEGGLSRSDTFYFEVTVPLVASLTPSSGPIGMPMTITGANFGSYNGVNTRVLIGGATAALSLWNDTTISGSIPGIEPGMKAVVVERLTSDGGRSTSQTLYFEVLLPEVLTLSPSSGPIGVPFTVTGRNFGPYNGSLTRVLVGGTTAALSVWNDGTISGTIPGLGAGSYPMVVERRTTDGGLASSLAGTFEVLTPAISELAPASGPMGMPFTITGTSFGPYNGANTRVLIGGTTSPLSLWNDSTIQGTAPALSSGTHSVVVERQSGEIVVQSNLAWFGVVVPEAASLIPSSGPIGMPFTITGTGFGPYNGANTRVSISGATAPLSIWNDTTITGTVPGSLSAGSHPVVIERATTGGLVSADAGSFEVTTPQVESVTPSSAPVGNAFTIRGTSFGSYNGANTRVLIGGTAAPLSLWNDSTISGRLPFLSTGAKAIVVERTAGGSLVQSNEASIELVAPVITTITPAVALQGTPFELIGTGFGQYNGSATRVLIGGTTAALSLWNDTMIRGLVPDSLPDALYAVVVERDALAGTVTSEPVYFIVDPPGSMAAPAAPEWFSEASLIVSTDTGGKVEAPSRASVEVPPAALEEETVITVSKPKDGDDEEKREKARKAQPIVKAGEPVEFGPEGTRFQQKVTIEVPFDPELVPPGKTWLDVALHYWNKDAGKWDPLETEVDMVSERLRAKTDHFSLYQPMVMGIKPEATASGDFNFRDVYVFPNPARGVNPTFRVQVGRADNVELTIMDVSGMVIDKGSCGSGQVRDIDNGMGNQFTFECTWDAHRAGSGVYTYMVRARKAGFPDIRVVKKLAIVK
ncbi:MAG: IPT/TIG domain-containing protein [Elusimicrobia bacterium]|nr:IPT/TIG domain-containing protein [Elusimicrobiota bacterium]